MSRLAPTAGERFLDVATGTGAVAARAARAGAEVTAIDLAPGMIEKARARSEPVEWLVGDAQELPFPVASFDVVASSFGVIFAPQAEIAAAELGRVCRGRIGLTAWEPHPEQRIWEPYMGAPATTAWSSEAGIRRLLPAFELEFEHGTWWLEAESGEAAWDWTTRVFPPMRERRRRLAPAELASARRSVVELYESFRSNGRVRYPRPYLLVVGSRR